MPFAKTVILNLFPTLSTLVMMLPLYTSGPKELVYIFRKSRSGQLDSCPKSATYTLAS